MPAKTSIQTPPKENAPLPEWIKLYGFSEDPFSIAPDPKYYFPAESHREALASIEYGISNRKGFILVIGEAGLGKTILIRRLLATLDPKTKVLFFPHSRLSFPEILKGMLQQLGLPAGEATKGAMIHELNHHLIRRLERDETVAIVIDAAEGIGMDVIEEVRLLANLETSRSKLLQIILVGRSGLREKLHQDVIRQIRQRIVLRCELTPLAGEESRQYIDHRLNIVGSGASRVFSDEALALICRHARGVPLAINVLCRNALALGCALAETKISAATIKRIRHEKEVMAGEQVRALADRCLKKGALRKWAYGLATAALLAAALFFGWQQARSLLDRIHLPSSITLVIPQAEQKTVPPAPEPLLQARPERPSGGQVPGVAAHPASETAALKPGATVPPRTTPAPAPPGGAPSPASPVPASPAAAQPERTHPAPPAAVQAAPPERKPSPASAAAPVKGNREIRIKAVEGVRAGANLYALAYRHYGEAGETYIDYIMRLNPEIRTPHLILVNQKIRIPEVNEALLISREADRFTIHLKTFTSLRVAERYRQQGPLQGKPTAVVPWRISPEETWYRVIAGPYDQWEQAAAAIRELR
jgi:general secretion pathway protein A